MILYPGNIKLTETQTMRMRKKPNLLPRMESCERVLIKNTNETMDEWKKDCRQYKEIALELGCGKGSFTAGTAKVAPDTMLIAIEKVPNAMIVAMERVCEEGIANVRFIDMDAANLVQIFSENEVSRIYINFCDPWPANKHIKRRLTDAGFLKIYKGVLKPAGEIHFKTDNKDLFEFSLRQFSKEGFTLEEVTRDLHAQGVIGIMTDYEAKFHSQGVPICRCVAKLMDRR